ncbi:hypothetical protein PG994_010069 [Apiospora phragmitis]|uniref:Uncharacterized protein n=1 Tax=Apiospora phragmitis TaxID=2905665 RepID=A0ABR1TNZ5_9PEZI
MAAQQPRDPLDVLQHTFNEIECGQYAGAINIKMGDTMKAYHYALDDLESEITRAKAVLLRDLEKLQAARMPAPEPSPPAAPPAPMMEDDKRPAAVMLEMPSTAAHTVHPNMGFGGIKEETKRVAPFPDMGMGMGLAADVVDLTSGGSGGDVKPSAAAAAKASPRVPPAAAVKAGGMGPARASPSIKQSPKPTPPLTTTKATPAAKAAPTPQQQQQQQPPAPPPATQAAPDNSMDATMTTGGAAMADMTGGELNFTNMEFTLAPTPGDGPSQNAPPAPMQDFDLSSFATSTTQNGGGGNDLLSLDHFSSNTAGAPPPPPDANHAGAAAGVAAAGHNNNNVAAVPQSTAPPAPAPAQATTDSAADSNANIDSLFDLDSAGGDNMDLDLNLGDAGGMGGMGENSFNDLFMPDGDMDQFDDQYFQLE